jgi:hypothetical protein
MDMDELDVSALPPTFDSLIEDVFGLNVRGLKTLTQLFAGPKKVFDSARVADWRSRYTPTLRLTFSIITVYMLLSFFWAAEDGAMYQTILAQLQEAAARNPDMPAPELVLEAYFAAFSVSYPFIYMIIHTLIGSLIWMWGSGTTWVTRIRLYFALLAVGMFFALLMVLGIPFISTEVYWLYSLVGMIVTLIAYAATYMRGMAGTYSTLGLTLRAIAISVIITIGDIVVAISSGIGASVWIQQFGP